MMNRGVLLMTNIYRFASGVKKKFPSTSTSRFSCAWCRQCSNP